MARRQTIAEGDPGTIRAIVVDPRERTVKAMDLPTSPGDPPRGFGTQIAPEALVVILGSKQVEQIDLGDSEVALVAARYAAPLAEGAWRYDEADEPTRGVGVVVNYDAEADAYADTKLSVDAVHRAVAFGDCGEAEENEEGRNGAAA